MVLLFLSDSTVSSDSHEYSAGTVILKIPDETPASDFEIGGWIRGEGKWNEFTHATNPGQFDEYDYYKSIGVDGKITGSVLYTDNTDASHFKTFLSSLRRSLSGSIDGSLMGEEEKAVLKAMILGDRSELTTDLKELYKNAGIIHLISISGLHITIIGMGLYRLIRRFGCSFVRGAAISALIMTAYVIMTGASVSSIRAIISFLILLGAEITGRTGDPLNTLSLAASVLLLSDPGLLLNTGFRLSFASVLGISLFISPQDPRSGPARLAAALRAGFGLWLFTLPVILSVYYEFPLYSVLFNLIAVTLSPLLLVSGLAGAFTGMVIPAAGDVFFLISGSIIRLNDTLTHVSSVLPCSVIVAGSPGVITVILYYLGIAALLFLKKREVVKLNDEITNRSVALRFTGLRILITSAMLALILIHPRRDTCITFLDVGQGDSILIRCANGSNIMIDAGSGNVSAPGKNRILPCLRSYGVANIDRLILTHPDSDHINAVDEVLDSNIEVGEILIAEVHSNDEAIIKLHDKVSSHNEYSINKINIRYIQRGDMFFEGNTSFNVLYPQGESNSDINSVSDRDIDLQTENDRNTTSIVIEMTEGDTRALFTGDLEKEGETILINSGLLEDVDILKVAHHGSKYSTTEEFLRNITPEIAIISCGKKNSYGHPHKETLDRLAAAGCKIYSTPSGGALEVEIGYEVNVKPYL
ncbi:MAG: DNA internalization-related competence protein ComEC/Rec2 [Lachnospiraceae bacterium]|nr:DNA internalization-related competence protein ComEC/Rec2 [Lachnospiraceae bacterium]